MPSRGILQLKIKGAQDEYLTGSPDISYFKTMFRRHIHFAIESVEQRIDGDQYKNSKLISIVKPQGDLLYKTWLEADYTSTVSASNTPSSADAWVAYKSVNVGDVIKGAITSLTVATNHVAGTTVNAISGLTYDGSAFDLANNASLGEAIKINRNGTHLVVSAKRGGSLSGGAFVYEESGGTWTLDTTSSNAFDTIPNIGGLITPSILLGGTDFTFGTAVDINDSGNTIVVSQPPPPPSTPILILPGAAGVTNHGSTGISGQTITLDGTGNKWLELPPPANFQSHTATASDNFSVAFFYNIDSVNAGTRGVALGGFSSTAPHGWNIEMGESVSSILKGWRFWINNNAYYTSLTDAKFDGMEHHIVVTVDKSNSPYVKIYIDGSLVTLDPSSTDLGNLSFTWEASRKIYVGRDSRTTSAATGTHPFNGILRNIKVWNVPIDSTFITNEYNESYVRPNTGNTYVYEKKLKEGSASIYNWELLSGSPLSTTPASNGCAGDGVAISGDGNIIATSQRDNAVSIWRWVPHLKTFHNRGEIVKGTNDANFGGHIAMNKLGTRLAIASCDPTQIASPGTKVYIYDMDNTSNEGTGIQQNYSWTLNTTLTEDALGGLEFNDSGDMLIMGAVASSNGTNRGTTKVYAYESANTWNVRGTIEGAADNDCSGLNVSINGNGDIIAIGGSTNITTPTTNIMEYDYSAKQYATKVTLNTTNDDYDTFVSLDSSGNNLAVGAPQQPLSGMGSNTSNSGYFKVNSLTSTNVDYIFNCTTAGTTGLTEPNWSAATTENTVSWSINPLTTSFYPTQSIDIYDLISTIEVQIGDNTIDKHTSAFMKTFGRLTCADGKRTAFDSLTTAVIPSKINNTLSTKLRVPLLFWFCKDAGNALPLISLKKDIVRFIIYTSSAFNGSLSLWTDLVYLDANETKKFINKEYVITQTQTSGTEGITTENEIRIDFNHPVKELIWTLDSTNHNKVDNVKLVHDGKERLPVHDGEYFSKVQRYMYHSGTQLPSDEDIYVYSFALDPEHHTPTGSMNYSFVENGSLVINGANIGAGAEIDVYAINWNVLRMRNGKGGLVFTD